MSFTALNFKDKEFKLKCSHKALIMIQNYYKIEYIQDIQIKLGEAVQKQEVDYILFAFLQTFHKEEFSELEKVKSFFFDEDSDLSDYFKSLTILIEGIFKEFNRSSGVIDNTNNNTNNIEVKENKPKKKI